MAGMNVSNAMNAYKTQTQISESKADELKSEKTEGYSKTSGLGKTVGEPKLSEKAEKYYNQLKKKYGQYDFILVSADEKENTRANAGKYANSLKTVVLIDEEKIEKMATDEKYRKQYEGILSGASQQIDQIKAAAQQAGANLNGIVMQVNDDGTTSFFAALQKSSDAQKARIEQKAAQKKAEKKELDKKNHKKALEKKNEERIKERKAEAKSREEKLTEAIDEDINKTENKNSDIITIMADSFEGLIKKIEEYGFDERCNNVQTESEKLVGQNIDYSC